jgi:chemotaxis protein methyltransferase CheR
MTPSWPEITAADFARISRFAHDRFGLELPPGKEALVAARVGKKIRQGGFRSFAEYHRYVLADPTGNAITELIDALTTNVTSFLREPSHFELLCRTAALEFCEARQLRVWSAACSSGEEPYSIAMALLDAPAAGCKWRGAIEILASDISAAVLGRAREGAYEAEKFRSLPEAWRRAYLLQGSGAKTGWCKVKPEVAALVRFERRNLLDAFPGRRFHYIFCRNVMIYFNRATQQDVVSRLAACLEPGGYLLTGHSESLNGIHHELECVQASVYRRKMNP